MNAYRFDSRDGRTDAEIHRLLDDWSHTPELRALVEAEGGAWPESPSLLEHLEELHQFSDRWDFRRGGERLDIDQNAEQLDEAAIRAAATRLGLTHASQPSLRAFDHVVIPGGTVLADYCRTRYARQLFDQGLKAKRAAFLGALREIPEQELAIALARPDMLGTTAPPLATEFDALLAVAERFFPAATEPARHDQQDENIHLGSAHANYQTRDGLEVEVLAAPSNDPRQRATTIDNYHSYAQQIATGDSLLICTSAIYVPYHFFVAVRALAFEKPMMVEVVGFPPEWMEGVLTGAHNYLQEIRSALFGALTLARTTP